MMIDIVTMAPDVLGEAVQSLERALDRLRSACNALDAFVTKLEAEGRPNELAGAIVSVTNAALKAHAEKEKVEDVLRIERGGDGLDLDAARAEIARRLDCILAAGDA